MLNLTLRIDESPWESILRHNNISYVWLIILTHNFSVESSAFFRVNKKTIRFLSINKMRRHLNVIRQIVLGMPFDHMGEFVISCPFPKK